MVFSSRWWGWFHNTILEEDHVGLSCYGSYAYVRAYGRAPPHPAALPHAIRSCTMPERCTLDGFVITPIEPQGSLYAGTDHGRLCINVARTGVMAWWSVGRWTA